MCRVTSNKSADGPGTGLPLLKVDSKTRRIMESSGWPMVRLQCHRLHCT